MDWHGDALRALHDRDVEVISYLPDSVVGPLVDRIEGDDRFEAIPVAREEEALAVLGGAWLGGRRGALVCQTSGLANTFNALGSLNVPWGLPFVGIVSRRGGLGEHNLAQIPAGYGMPALLDAMGVRNDPLERPEDVERIVSMAADTAFATETPYVLLAEPTLTGGKR